MDLVWFWSEVRWHRATSNRVILSANADGVDSDLGLCWLEPSFSFIISCRCSSCAVLEFADICVQIPTTPCWQLDPIMVWPCGNIEYSKSVSHTQRESCSKGQILKAMESIFKSLGSGFEAERGHLAKSWGGLTNRILTRAISSVSLGSQFLTALRGNIWLFCFPVGKIWKQE